MTVTIIILTMRVIFLAKLTNDSNEDKTVTVHAGEGFMQGIFGTVWYYCR